MTVDNTLSDKPVVIIGAGISGLAAAITLKEAGVPVLLFEMDNAVGGRVRTDSQGEFLLDRGFQIFLKSYPEGPHFLDYPSLDFRPFLPGARILWENKNYLVVDPFRKIRFLFDSLFAPIGNLKDKFILLKLKMELLTKDAESLFLKKETTTLEYLRNYGFSEPFIQKFFVPFYGGIFLENELKTSSRMFEFTFKMFGMGDTAIPALGMEEIPKQMAQRLGMNAIRFGEKVSGIEIGSVITNKSTYPSRAVIFAGGRLENFPGPLPADIKNRFFQKNPRSAWTLYFSSAKAPIPENIIVLNANKNRLVNTLAVMNSLSNHYAPRGEYLLSLTLLDPENIYFDHKLIDLVKEEMSSYFPEARSWEFIRSYSIPYALPDQDRVQNGLSDYRLPHQAELYHCGDYMLNGSINAAMKSGREVAEQFLREHKN